MFFYISRKILIFSALISKKIDYLLSFFCKIQRFKQCLFDQFTTAYARFISHNSSKWKWGMLLDLFSTLQLQIYHSTLNKTREAVFKKKSVFSYLKIISYVSKPTLLHRPWKAVRTFKASPSYEQSFFAALKPFLWNFVFLKNSLFVVVWVPLHPWGYK